MERCEIHDIPVHILLASMSPSQTTQKEAARVATSAPLSQLVVTLALLLQKLLRNLHLGEHHDLF